MTWDYKKKNADKQAKSDPIWRLERAINFGSPKTKLKRAELKKYLPKLRISPDRRAFLSLILWEKKKF